MKGFRFHGLLALAALLGAAVLADAAEPVDGAGAPGRIAFRDKRIRESSGLARSIRNEDAIWTHNDSGGGARLFLVDLKSGATRLVCSLAGLRARDWEDMAAYERDDRAMLVVGDVGSNRNDRRPRLLHFIDEPLAGATRENEVRETPVWATLEFQFEDGFPDCEALAVDDAMGTVWLASKVRSGACGVYRLDLPERAGRSSQTATRVAQLELPMITAMDLRADGRRMLLLTYVAIWEFRLPEGRTWPGLLPERPDVILFAPLGRQVEAICYSDKENEFHLSAEGRGASLWTRKLPLETPSRKGKGGK